MHDAANCTMNFIIYYCMVYTKHSYGANNYHCCVICIQLVQPESNVVGCGAANCPTVTGLPILPDAVVLVCNYASDQTIR